MTFLNKLLSKIGITKKGSAPDVNYDGQFRFKVCYHSPYFVLYIKCPEQKHWQVARAAEEVTDLCGTIRPTVRASDLPVMYFATSKDAINYAVVQLHMTEAQLEVRTDHGFTAAKSAWVTGVKNYEDLPSVVHAKLMPSQPDCSTRCPTCLTGTAAGREPNSKLKIA
jgi:hypothetical protein